MIDAQKYPQKYRKMLEQAITPRYCGEVFSMEECPVPLIGNDIIRHLSGCKSVLVCAGTLGAGFDRLLRKLQVADMAGAVIVDELGGEYIEEFCDENDAKVIKLIELQLQLPRQNRTGRFSPGYGDFPLSVNRDIVKVLNGTLKAGLCVSDDFILTPQKSITGIVGIL